MKYSDSLNSSEQVEAEEQIAALLFEELPDEERCAEYGRQILMKILARFRPDLVLSEEGTPPMSEQNVTSEPAPKTFECPSCHGPTKLIEAAEVPLGSPSSKPHYLCEPCNKVYVEGLSIPLSDISTYERMAAPYASEKEARAALNAFIAEVYQVRIKHRIPEVMIVAMTYISDRRGIPIVYHVGNQSRMADLATIGMRQAALQRAEMLRREAEMLEARAAMMEPPDGEEVPLDDSDGGG